MTIAPEWQVLARDYALHRLRCARARRRGLLHPIDLELGSDRLTLRFSERVLDAATPPLPLRGWRDRVLAPALRVLVECLRHGILGFDPPVSGRWIPPVSWFLPRPPSFDSSEAITADLQVARGWLDDQLRLDPGLPRNDPFVGPLLDALEKGDIEALDERLSALETEGRRQARLEPDAPSFLALLTEAELLERVTTMHRFRMLTRKQAAKFGFRLGHDECLLEVDLRWRDQDFPRLERPSVQELWDALVEESKTTPMLVVGEQLPNPLTKAGPREPRIRWIGAHEDQPFLVVHRGNAKIPEQGFVRLHSVGDDTLMQRKRVFTELGGDHPSLEALLAEPPAPVAFVENPQPRDVLEAAISSTRGIFAVQGPPGTGKTHLATEVVRQLLARTPGARVLVCAKEHFALGHILRKITSALSDDGIEHRAWHSVSLAKQRRGRGEIDPRWLAPAVTRELAERNWASEAVEWVRWQACTSDAHDRRLTSLGQGAADLFFCTTMDGAMVEFLDTESFDLVVVEEAGKCYPSEIVHALCLGRIVLMIGDHRQLPPYQERRTRERVEAWHQALHRANEHRDHRDRLRDRFGDTFEGLFALLRDRGPLSPEELSWLRPFELLFDRLATRHRLEEQFRMEAPLSRVVGEVFYDRPFEHRKPELLARGLLPAQPLGEVIPSDLDVPLLWIDTPHMVDRPEATEDPGKRGVRDSQYEHDVLVAYLKRLRPAAPIDMVILTPYNAQKSLLLASEPLQRICSALTNVPFNQVVRTTDEYQGREAELTVLSLVRNNSLGARAWGFMTEPERLNVMFSRARFRQVVVGCSAHIERHAEEARWLYAVWKAYQGEARDPSCARIIPAAEVLGG